jgi:hypothetical protein
MDRRVRRFPGCAATGGDIIARGTVSEVRIDDRTEVATLDVAPPERVFPVRERADP